jgi:hypothetical protein
MIRDRNCPLAEMVIDLIAGYAFNETDYNKPIKEGANFLFMESTTKHWISGNSILTVKSGKMGWSQVTIRRATGTVEWIMQLQHQVVEP